MFYCFSFYVSANTEVYTDAHSLSLHVALQVYKLLEVIKRRAYEHKLTPTIGRSHGIHAEPVTFGLKMAEAYAEFSRCKARLIAARAEVATCAISDRKSTRLNSSH